jgi:quinol monooxygenase YgiN
MCNVSSVFGRAILALVTIAAAVPVVLSVVPVGSVNAADEQIVLTTRVYPAPGREAETEARVVRFVELVKKAEPDITYRLHRSTKEPTIFLFYEVYPSQAAFDKHRTVTIPAVRSVVGAAPEGLLARPLETEIYRILIN